MIFEVAWPLELQKFHTWAYTDKFESFFGFACIISVFMCVCMRLAAKQPQNLCTVYCQYCPASIHNVSNIICIVLAVTATDIATIASIL